MNKDTREEGFLGRWSRLKTGARETPAQPPAHAAPPTPASSTDNTPPELPPVESLTIESDFRAFLHPKVNEDLKRSALRKLFSDPHFNVMDGLDVYVDDYSVSEPIPAAMLAGMKQAQRILGWAEGKDDEEQERLEQAAAEEAAAGAIEVPVEDAATPAAEARTEYALANDHAPDAVPTPDPVPEAVAKPA